MTDIQHSITKKKKTLNQRLENYRVWLNTTTFNRATRLSSMDRIDPTHALHRLAIRDILFHDYLTGITKKGTFRSFKKDSDHKKRNISVI